MITVEESRLIFELDETKYRFIKFDDDNAYRRVEKELKPTHGVDFILLVDEKRPILMEIKNYLNHTGDKETKDKFKNKGEQLLNHIALKVRDSLACSLAAARFSTNDSEFWTTFNTAVIQNDYVIVVAWIEFDGQNNRDKKAKMQIWNNKLKQKLHWIHAVHTSVNNMDNPLPENIVSINVKPVG